MNPKSSGVPAVPDLLPIPLLEAIQKHGRTWAELAPRCGVTEPDPPWKVSLHAMCECLSVGGTLPSLERRHTEDQLGETLYSAAPAPEQQLLALADTMLRRGLFDEEGLTRRMREVRSRLEAS